MIAENIATRTRGLSTGEGQIKILTKEKVMIIIDKETTRKIGGGEADID